MTDEEIPAHVTCPKCGGNLIRPITNGVRCVAFGYQFNEVRDPVGESARRRKAEGFRGVVRPPK